MNLENYLKQHLEVFQNSKSELEKVELVAERMKKIFMNGGKILVAGNGGSAADAQHFAAELVGRFESEREGFNAIALTTDTSAITAISNDYGFDRVFSRQVQAIGKPGDMFIGITTSGKSASIINALLMAHQLGMSTVLLTGDGCEFKDVDHTIVARSSSTAFIQEFHIFVIHCICRLIDWN